MTSKFYLHDAATGVTGTLPATNASVSAVAPTWTPGATNSVANTPLLTNKSMDGTIGALQTSLAYATDNVTTDQHQPLLRFVSPALAAQTIAAQLVTLAAAGSESNALSNFIYALVLGVWRPSTGANVGLLFEIAINWFGVTVTTTTEAAGSATSAGNSQVVTTQDGDVLVAELWRDGTVQSMATSYTNTVFYDGTTEADNASNAAYILFTNDVTLSSGGSAMPPGLGPLVGMFEPFMFDTAMMR